MQNKYLLIALALLLPTAAQAVMYKVIKDPHTEITLEFLLGQRVDVQKKDLADDKSKKFVLDDSIFNTKNVLNEFGWEPGIKGSLMQTFDKHDALELSLAWIHQWKGRRGVSGEATLTYPFFSIDYTHDYRNASEVDAKYASQLWDAEANYWRIVTPRGVDYFSVSWILGLRGFYLKENFALEYTRSQDTSIYLGRAKNRLLGGQLGGNIQVNPYRQWSFEVTLKTGVLGDWSNGASYLHDINNTVLLRSQKDHELAATWLIDFEFQLFYNVAKWLSFHAGYRWIDLMGVALAPSMLTRSTDPARHLHIDKSGKTQYNIISLGLTLEF